MLFTVFITHSRLVLQYTYRIMNCVCIINNTSCLNKDVQCDAIAIRELCESRDQRDDLMFNCSELHIFSVDLEY